MPKRYMTNDTASPIFVGGVMILPGTGREVDEAFLPPEGPDDGEPADSEGGDPDAQRLKANLLELLAQSVGKIEQTLPDASDETLAALELLEAAAATPRKTLLAAIAAEKLNRAQKKAGAPT
jgi:hypothetical protein